MDPLDEELLAVARDLCAVAAAFLLLGDSEQATCQLECAMALLEERGLVTGRCRPARLEVH